MLCKGSPELGKSAGKGFPELGASGRGTLCMCQETCLSAVPSAGKGSPELESSDRGKQAVCQETRLSAAPIVRCGRSAPAIAMPERNTRGCAESYQRGIRHTLSTRTTVIRFLHGVVSQLFCADVRKCGT